IAVQRLVKVLGGFGSGWLNRAQFVRAARQEFAFLSVPIPLQGKPRMCHGICRRPKLGIFPALAAVGGYFHLANRTSAGTSQDAPLCTPASLSSTERRTPVHSLQLVIPCVSCTVLCVGLERFPMHSIKCTRVTDGKRFNSSMVKISGRSTMPWIMRRCSFG